ncbi:cytochrome P450 [Umbelopsis sp. PMI_123]|nr:cytochrome P450 [Umbelopsis sp. PMI_123]
MQIENYINSEIVKDTVQKLLNTISQVNKTEVVSVVACAVAAQYILNTFFLDNLRSIPGPFGAKLSRFYEAKLKASGQEYLLTDELHNKYGKVVRKGINTVSIRDPAAVKQIYGSERFRKPSFYKAFIFNGAQNMFSTSEPSDHARLRRMLAPGFSQATLDSLEDVIMESGVLALMDKFSSKFADQDVVCNLFTEFHLVAFDILAELAFGKSFDMVKQQTHPFLGWLKARSPLLPYTTTFPGINDHPRLLRILFPKSIDGITNILNFSQASLDARAADKNATRRDFTQLMLEALQSDKKASFMTVPEIQMSSVMLMIAGTDTTSNSMTFTAFLLGKHPDVRERLFQELLDAMPDKNSTLRYKDARKDKMPYLWGVIMEATRLYPAVPGGLPRVTPKGGEVIAGQFIPEGTVVEVPTWSIHHDESIFDEPFAFKPERWLGDDAEELAKHHLIFSIGPRMCAGKNLAMMEMTLTIAHLYRRFDVTLADPNETMPLVQRFLMKPTSDQMNVYLRSRDQ